MEKILLKQQPLATKFKIRSGPDGTHFFNRATGTNLLINEVIPSKEAWTRSPRQVSIALTNACDLSCSHCYASKKSATLKTEFIKRCMLELDQNDCFGVGFGGGEPFLHPDFLEICKFGQENTGLAISVTTHGHRLTPELVEHLQYSLNFIRISMDGTGQVYEDIRGRNFNVFLNKLNLLKGHIPFGINYVVNERTVNDLSLAADIAEETGATELLLLPEVGVGLGSQISDVTTKLLQGWIKNYQGSLRLSISSAHVDSVDTQLPLTKEHSHLSFAHIDAHGVLKGTSFDTTGVPIGSTKLLDAFKRLHS